MGPLKVTVINKLAEKITLLEGIAGNYRHVATIGPHGLHYVMKFEANATYREYACVYVTGSSQLELTLTSDDLTDFEEVRITRNTGHSLEWSGTRRNQGGMVALVADDNIKEGVTTVGNLFSKIFKGVGSWLIGKKQPRADQQNAPDPQGVLTGNAVPKTKLEIDQAAEIAKLKAELVERAAPPTQAEAPLQTQAEAAPQTQAEAPIQTQAEDPIQTQAEAPIQTQAEASNGEAHANEVEALKTGALRGASVAS